jgi:hypothetical protein
MQQVEGFQPGIGQPSIQDINALQSPGGVYVNVDVADDPNMQNLEYRVTGRLKFFNEGQSYGFILSDIDGKDLFFHFDDMKKTNLSK